MVRQNLRGTMNWNDELAVANRNLDALRKAHPDAGKGFSALHHATMTPGALTAKEKEFVAIAIGIHAQCSDCIGFHVRAGVKAGMTRDELAEVIGVTMMMGGGPAFMYGARALEAYDQFKTGT
jgi:AhpD family alkylhydroperoxidase